MTQNPSTPWEKYRELVLRGTEPSLTDKTALRLREDLVREYIYLAPRVAGKMKKSMPPYVESDDLESLAKIGLLQAVSRFDHTLGVPFEAFATQRMRSVIMDGVREADWVTRSLRKKQRDIKKVEDAYSQANHREPTTEEIAAELQISENAVLKTKYQAAISTHTYLESSTEALNKPANVSDAEDDLVDLMKQVLATTLRELPIRQAAIVALHYYEEKKLATIAQLLQMSEAKVGALHTEAVIFIWQKLSAALKNDA